MFRMWGKIWKDNHLLKDTVVENDAKDTRTHKIFQALEEICYDFDLGKPIWLSSNVSEFQRHSKPVSEKTVLSRKFLLIIWRYR